MALPKFLQKQTHLIKKKVNEMAQLIREFVSKSDKLNSIPSTQTVEDITNSPSYPLTSTCTRMTTYIHKRKTHKSECKKFLKKMVYIFRNFILHHLVTNFFLNFLVVFY